MRKRLEGDYHARDFSKGTWEDVEALLAVVEAAKLAWDHGTNENLDDLGEKLDRLYDSD